LVTSGRDVSAAPTGGSFLSVAGKKRARRESDRSVAEGGARLAAKPEENV
jgi:hypothetical protein